MLVFGAVQLKSSNDGGIEIIHDGTHQYLTKDEVAELSSWLSYHQQRKYMIRGNNNQRNNYGMDAAVTQAFPIG